MKMKIRFNDLTTEYIVYGLIFSLAAFLLYPRPKEIILMYFVGFGIMCLLIRGSKCYASRAHNNKVFEYGIPWFIIIYILCFMNVFAVSWFEKRIVWNIFQTERGKVYIAINIGLLTICLSYIGVFYLRHGRWPESKELGIKN